MLTGLEQCKVPGQKETKLDLTYIYIHTHTHTHTCIHTYTLPTPSRQGSLQLKTAGFTKCAVQTNVPFFLIPRIKWSAAGRIAKLSIKLVAFMAQNHSYGKLKAVSDTMNKGDVEAL